MSNLVGSYIAFIGPEGAKPSYVIMVKVWGEGEALGGSAAQSLFESMENFIIDYLKIKPGGV